ncbi:MAG: response regulator [Bacteroidia bacterium]|nr:response regulator [Bacteroidia bacterium]
MRFNRKSMSVFLVDDDPMHNKAMEHNLSSNPFLKIKKFGSGEECLENLNENPKIIVLDYHLDSIDKKAMNGIHILKQIKKRKPAITVIMLSSQESLSVAKNSIKYDAYDYIVKGESGMLRANHLINNIRKQSNTESDLNEYRVYSKLLAGIVILIITFTLTLNHFYPELFSF